MPDRSELTRIFVKFGEIQSIRRDKAEMIINYRYGIDAEMAVHMKHNTVTASGHLLQVSTTLDPINDTKII